MKPGLLFYCQHTLGMGHLVRSMELVKGLTAEFAVTFINGGKMVDGLSLPPDVHIVQLPAITTDADFGSYHSSIPGVSLTELLEQRAAKILDAFEAVAPQIVVIELFPFGRRRFAPEIVPLLERARRSREVQIVSSVRDILVQKQDRDRFEEKVCRTINTYFDLILVHSDPGLHRLENSFTRTCDLQCAVEYTGYVSQEQPLFDDRCHLTAEKLIVASIGGGRVGSEILSCAIDASLLVQHHYSHRLVLFAGPYMAEETLTALRTQAAPHSRVEVHRFTPDLCGYLRRASLSVSMAGYNTCMNILATGVRAIVCPFTGNGDSEQTERGRHLERLGLVRVLERHALNSESLAHAMSEELDRPPETKVKHQLNMRGVENSVAALVRQMRRSKSERTYAGYL